MLFDRKQVCPYQGVMYLLEARRAATPSAGDGTPGGNASAPTSPAKGVTMHTRFGHNARYSDTAHHARFNLSGSRGNLNVEGFDICDSDRLYLGRQSFHGL